MKIGITGSHGVGKTVLVRAVEEQCKLPIIPEIARLAHNEGFTILTDNSVPDIRAELAMIGYQIIEEQKAENFIADRILLDYYVYTKRFVDIPFSFQRALKNFVLEYCATHYDYIFYVPIEFPLKSDNLRSTDVETQTLIDNEIKSFLEILRLDYEKDYYEVTGSVNARLSKIVGVIKPWE